MLDTTHLNAHQTTLRLSKKTIFALSLQTRPTVSLKQYFVDAIDYTQAPAAKLASLVLLLMRIRLRAPPIPYFRGHRMNAFNLPNISLALLPRLGADIQPAQKVGRLALISAFIIRSILVR